MKRHLATYFPEQLHTYAEVKDPVCDIIMASAQDWAATNWQSGLSDALCAGHPHNKCSHEGDYSRHMIGAPA